jgi:hypothetical protein
MASTASEAGRFKGRIKASANNYQWHTNKHTKGSANEALVPTFYNGKT